MSLDPKHRSNLQRLRQWPALQNLIESIASRPFYEGALLIGSLASSEADPVSDLDVVAVVEEGSFSPAWLARHGLHDRVLACWDTGPEHEVGAHKWLTEDLVLVECLITAPSAARLAPLHLVLLGPDDLPDRLPPRPPVDRTEMTGASHPVEVAYDALKSAIRKEPRSSLGNLGEQP